MTQQISADMELLQVVKVIEAIQGQRGDLVAGKGKVGEEGALRCQGNGELGEAVAVEDEGAEGGGEDHVGEGGGVEEIVREIEEGEGGEVGEGAGEGGQLVAGEVEGAERGK